jgi:quinol monooxygenase YgiN
MIKRNVPKEKEREALALVAAMRMLASRQPGYVSGETMRNAKQKNEFLIISTWQTVATWDAYVASARRKEFRKKLDDLLGAEAEYNIYEYPDPATLPPEGDIKFFD